MLKVYTLQIPSLVMSSTVSLKIIVIFWGIQAIVFKKYNNINNQKNTI